MKKITLFHHEFCVSGGAEHTMLDVIDYLVDEGYEYICYAPIVDRTTCFPERIKKYKIRPLLPYVRWIPRELYPIVAAMLSPILLLRCASSDLFYGANQTGPLLAYVCSKIFHKPYIVYMPYPLNILYPRTIDKNTKSEMTLITRLILKIGKPIIAKLDQKVIMNATAVITEGQYALSIFKKIYKREILNAPASAPTVSAERAREIDKFNGEILINKQKITKPFILVTNRHVPKKKFEYALMMMERIKKTETQIPTLVITGTPTAYTQELIDLASKLTILQNIIFTNLVSEEEITRLYQHAAVYIYTAPEEDYGKGVIQAQGNATPVVVWDKGGPAYSIIPNQTGFIASFPDIDLYTSFVMKLINNKKLNEHFSQAARNLIKSNFSTQQHKKVVLTAIKQAMLY